MTTSWYDTSYRKLFFDFHSPGAATELAAAFDAQGWAARLQDAGAQAVSVFAKGGYGYSFYRQGSIRYPHPNLPPGLDMLGEQIEALHQRQIRAIGYYHTFNSEPVARDYPEWRRRDAAGNPVGIGICMLSPLLDEWMLPHLHEIVTLYDVDAMFFDGTYAHSPCYCPSCQRRFAEASGGLETPAGKDDPHWAQYVAWKLEALRQVRRSICETIHAQRPEVVISFNWSYTLRMPEVVPSGVGALVADIYPDDQVFNGSYLSAYWAMLERPFDVMNSAFLQWWGDWGCKPAVAMQQEVATTIAHGGLTWIGYQMTHEFDVAPAVMGEMAKTLDFVRQRESLLTGAAPVPNVAVLHSTTAHLANEAPAFWIDELGAHGVHRALLERMIPHHFVHEQTLIERLDAFKVVILPDQRYLSPDLVQALSAWVERGGVLLATALTGTLDGAYEDTGTFALGDLLGVRLEGVYDQPHAYIEVTEPRLEAGTLDMPHLAEGTFVLARPVSGEVRTLAKLLKIYLRSDGEFLLRWSPPGEDTGYPAITARQVGAGWAAYLAGQVFRAYQAKNQWNLKHIVANLIEMLVAQPLVEVDAPAWLEVVLMAQPAEHAPGGRRRTLVHLVNQHGDRPLDDNNRCTEQVIPVRDVEVRVACPQRPAGVTLEPGNVVPEWSYDGGTLTVVVPQVDIHCAIAIEEGA
jgi:hypothetical protein